MTADAAQSAGHGDQPAVVVDGVWKRFGTTDVVADLSFTVGRGEILGFLGPNGAGKTTTMRMILDIIRPDRGSIRVFGQRPQDFDKSGAGYLPEDRGLYRDVPVVETLAYFGALRGLRMSEARQRARRMLTDVGLGDSVTKKAAELSCGTARGPRRVVASALAARGGITGESGAARRAGRSVASARVFRATLLLYGVRPSARSIVSAILDRG